MKKVWESLKAEKSMLVCDFDGTLTVSGSSMHAAAKILGAESPYTQARDLLYQQFGWVRSADGDQEIRKNAAMVWWKKQMNLYVQYGISRGTLLRASLTLPPREDCVELLRLCIKNEIPVWIVSAGIANVIEYWLEWQEIEGETIHVLANRILYRGDKPMGYTPVMTIWNKEEMFFRYAENDCGQKMVFLGDRKEDVGWRKEHSESFLLDRGIK